LYEKTGGSAKKEMFPVLQAALSAEKKRGTFLWMTGNETDAPFSALDQGAPQDRSLYSILNAGAMGFVPIMG